MPLARARNLTALTSGVLLVLSLAASSAHAGASSNPGTATSAMAAVAGGAVTGADGAAMAGVAVDLYAWPSDAVLNAMKAGQFVRTTLLGTATTSSAGKYMLRVPAAKLKAAAVESGYANLEVFSAVGGIWFLSYQASSLPAHPSAPVTVNFSPDLGVKCGKDSLHRPLAFSGFVKLKQLKPAWVTVGQGYIVPQKKTKGDFMQFDYNKGATHTQTSGLGVGISGYGIDAGYNTSGSNTSTADSEQDFPNETKNTHFRTDFNVGLFRGVCHGHSGDNSVPQEKQHSSCPRKYVADGFTYYVHKCFWMVRSTGWFGLSTNVTHPSKSPRTPGKFCGQELKNSTGKTHTQKAVQWSGGFDIGASDKIKGAKLKVSFSSSAQTGYDTNAQMLFRFKQDGWICGTNHDPKTAAQLVMRGNRA